MSKDNPDISLDIHNALMSMLHAEKKPDEVVADIMRIPLEQVVDGSVYQFELVRECERCEGVGLIQDALTCHNCIQGPSDQYCSEHFNTLICEACACTDGEIVKRISHYDLTVDEIYSGYFVLRIQPYKEPLILPNNKGTMRAVKVRTV